MSFDWSFVLSTLTAFGQSVWVTLQLGAIVILTSLVVALLNVTLLGLHRPWLTRVIRAYVELARNTPLLIQLFFLYFGLPALGISLSGFATAVIAMTFLGGGYLTEALRAGIGAVPPSQLEAGRAFGMSRWKVFRRIWLPQAIHRALPTLAGETVLQLKATPLVATITVVDIYAVASRVRQETFIIYEPLLLLALIYLVITGCLVFLFRRLEARLPARLG